MKRLRVAIIQEAIPNYRIPLFNHLSSEYFDLTVFYVKGDVRGTQFLFRAVKVAPSKLLFLSYFNFLKLVSDFDAVVGMYNLKWPSIWLLPILLKKRIRFVFWGIGLSTEQGLGVDSRFDIPRFLIARLANGLLFYSNYPLSKYENFGISKSSMFVAHNTVYVESKVFPPPSMNKAYILFFGSLTS